MSIPSPPNAGNIGSGSSFAQQWHHRPTRPITASPIFEWPPNPAKAAAWLGKSWLFLTERLLILGVALLSWICFQPPLTQTRVWTWHWVAPMYARNLILMSAVAGGLHLYFYTWRRQGQRLQFDGRPFKQHSKLFTLNSQLRDNMFWTLVSGVAIWTAYEALIIWLMANGYAPVLNAQAHPIWFVALFVLTPLWVSVHFYFVHRALHWPPLFKLAHALHHRNTNVGPWSGISMHPLEHLLYLSSALIHCLLATHPVHLLFHMQYLTLGAVTSHSGFEGVLANGRIRLPIGSFRHQMHHRYFECNYGDLEVPLDQWFGSFHDGTAEAHERMKGRRR